MLMVSVSPWRAASVSGSILLPVTLTSRVLAWPAGLARPKTKKAPSATKATTTTATTPVPILGRDISAPPLATALAGQQMSSIDEVRVIFGRHRVLLVV